MAVSRRLFLGGVTAASYSRLRGANDRVGIGFIGFGLIGAQHVKDFSHQKDADLVAMCEVYQPRLEQGVAACGARAKGYSDFRGMLEDKDVHAVVVSTPDHWHALMTIMACAAGKDVYVEKPLTVFIQRRPLDGECRAAIQPRGANRHTATVRAALPEGTRPASAEATSAR